MAWSIAFIHVAEKLKAITPANENEKLGIKIVRRAIDKPLHMIVENAYLKSNVAVNEVKNVKSDYDWFFPQSSTNNCLPTELMRTSRGR